MSDNVALFPGITPLPFDANVMLDMAKNANLTSVVIIGYDADGDEFFSSSVAGGPEILWLLERTKMNLLSIVDE